MAKAVIAKDDFTITIEGTEDEVYSLVKRFEDGERGAAPSASGRKRGRGTNNKPTPTDLICSMIKDGFFSTPKELGLVRLALEEQGHFYPVTTLSPLLLRLVRNRMLRRIKEKKHWTYVE